MTLLKVALDNKHMTLIKLVMRSLNSPMFLIVFFNNSIKRVGILEDFMMSCSSEFEF